MLQSTISDISEKILGLASLRSELGRLKAARVVYTAVFGGYDKVEEPCQLEEGIDYVCFTDDENFRSDKWQPIYVPFTYRDPRRTAKIFKILPHLFFPHQEASLWIDGSCVVIGSLRDFLIRYCCHASMVTFPHPKRRCLYQEARACRRWGKETSAVVQRQIRFYRESGYPEGNGLIAGTVLVRRHNEKKVVELMEEWWRHIDRFSVRDQISFNFVAWQQKFDIEYFPFSIYDNPYFIWGGHSKFIFFDGNGKRMISPKIVLSLLYNKLRHRKRA